MQEIIGQIHGIQGAELTISQIENSNCFVKIELLTKESSEKISRNIHYRSTNQELADELKEMTIELAEKLRVSNE